MLKLETVQKEATSLINECAHELRTFLASKQHNQSLYTALRHLLCFIECKLVREHLPKNTDSRVKQEFNQDDLLIEGVLKCLQSDGSIKFHLNTLLNTWHNLFNTFIKGKILSWRRERSIITRSCYRRC